MNYIKQHISFRIATLLVAVCLMTPILVKFSHTFSDHKHEVCVGENQSHFHEIDMDCEFFKFNINLNTFIVFFNYNLKSSFDTSVSETLYYTYLKSHQQLTDPLRGPPSLLI